MKRFKKILGMALAFSLVITQFPSGKAAKAAGSEAVKILPRASWSDAPAKGTLVDTTTAAKAFNTATLTVESSPETNFGNWFEMHVIITVNGKETDLKYSGTGNGTAGETATVKLTDFTVNKGDQYKIEVYSDAWQDKYVEGVWSLQNDYTYKVSVRDFTFETTEKPDTPPSGDDDTSKTGEVQTSGGHLQKSLQQLFRRQQQTKVIIQQQLRYNVQAM